MSGLVSIIIPVYNREKEVLNSIQSVIEQEYAFWEIILIDDGSETKEYQELISDSRIRIINNDKNRGVSYSRNVGIREAKGDYIVFLDSDNRMKRNYLKKMICCIEKTEAQAVFSQWDYIYDDNPISCMNEKSEQYLSSIIHKIPNETSFYCVDSKEFLITAVLNEINFSHINAVLVKRDCILYFHEELFISEDTVWIYELLSKIEKIGYVRNNLLEFISSKDSVYLFMNRCKVSRIEDLTSEQVNKLCISLSGSIDSYRFLVELFSEDKKFSDCVMVFKKAVERKSYTLIIMKEIAHHKIQWKDVKSQSLIVKSKYLLGITPISINKINYSNIDIF